MILLIRDPYDALLSEYNREKSPGKDHTGMAPIRYFTSPDWKRYVKGRVVKIRQVV